MELTPTPINLPDTQQATPPRGSHAPSVGRDVHARLAGARPNKDADIPPFWGDDGFTFDDLVDLVNPLHHIPLIGSLYRSLTGDQIAAGPRIMGSALFAGGPVGAMAAAAGNAIDAGVAHNTGNDIGGHVLSWLGLGDDAGTESPATVAEGAPVHDAALGGMPWIEPSPVAQVMTQSPAPATQESAVLPPPDEPVAEATLAETAAGMRMANEAAGSETNLSDHQWQMLVASLEPQELVQDGRGNGMDGSHPLIPEGRRRVELDPRGPTASKCQWGRASSSQANRRVGDED